MKKIACLVVPVLVSAVACFAQDRAPELPDSTQFDEQRVERDRSGEIAVATPAAASTDVQECPALNLAKTVLTSPFLGGGWGVDESVAAEGRTVGKLEGSYPGNSFTFTGVSGQIIAAAAVVDDGALRVAAVGDCLGRPIGRVVDKSMSREIEIYEVQDAHGKPLASSGQVSSIEDKIALADSSGRVVARLQLGTSVFSPKSALDAGSLDPRLVLMVEAMKEYADARRDARRSRRPMPGGRLIF